jgi:hypothetical protein
VLGVGTVESLIGGALVGRLEDTKVASLATQNLLRAPVEYTSVVTGLSPRPAPGHALDTARVGEFLYRDAYGRLAKVRFDADWHPDLRDVLNTTPGHRRIAPPLPATGVDFVQHLFAPESDLQPVGVG